MSLHAVPIDNGISTLIYSLSNYRTEHKTKNAIKYLQARMRTNGGTLNSGWMKLYPIGTIEHSGLPVVLNIVNYGKWRDRKMILFLIGKDHS